MAASERSEGSPRKSYDSFAMECASLAKSLVLRPPLFDDVVRASTVATSLLAAGPRATDIVLLKEINFVFEKKSILFFHYCI